MTVRSLFLIAVSGLLIAITVIASLIVAVETKNSITADVQEQKMPCWTRSTAFSLSPTV